MTLIGELYAQGLGVRRDLTEAERWYKLGADRGDRQATFALGLAKLTGTGVAKGPRRRRRAASEGGGGGPSRRALQSRRHGDRE